MKKEDDIFIIDTFWLAFLLLHIPYSLLILLLSFQYIIDPFFLMTKCMFKGIELKNQYLISYWLYLASFLSFLMSIIISSHMGFKKWKIKKYLIALGLVFLFLTLAQSASFFAPGLQREYNPKKDLPLILKRSFDPTLLSLLLSPILLFGFFGFTRNKLIEKIEKDNK